METLEGKTAKTTPVWPPLIRRPLAQRRSYRRFYQLATLVAWGGWLYLFVPLITLLLWLSGLRTAWTQAPVADRAGGGDVQSIAIAALISAFALIVWGELERRRFAGSPPRPVSEHDEVRSVSEGMHIPLRDVYRLRDGRRALVNFTPEGRILRVDGQDRPAPSRSIQMDTMLQRLAETVADARSLEELTRPMLAMMEVASGFDSVYLTTIDQDTGLQHILFSHNVRRMQVPEGLAIPWQDTLCKRALEAGDASVTDVPARWPEAPAASALGIYSYASAPVHVGGELYGTLCAASSRPLTFGTETHRLLQMFAKLIGQHIEREGLLARVRQRNEDLSAAARIDPLTSLGNRRALLAELARMLARAERDESKVYVARLDLDDFKSVNERHGREVGDALLAAVAARLHSVLRGGDFAARYGGDEFAVLSWSADGKDPTDSMRQRLSTATRGRFELGTTVLDYVGASVGVVVALPGETSDAVLARAEQAMAEVKRRRRVPTGG